MNGRRRAWRGALTHALVVAGVVFAHPNSSGAQLDTCAIKDARASVFAA